MPKAFLIRKKLGANWCPVTPPPSPEEMLTPENLSVRDGVHTTLDGMINNTVLAHQNNKQRSLPLPVQMTNNSNSIADIFLNMKNTHSLINDCSYEPCAVDLTISSSSKLDTTSFSPNYGSSLSSPISYDNSESDFEIKGMFTFCLFFYYIYSSPYTNVELE